MKIEKKTHYLSIRSKRFWWIIGNAFGNGFTIVNLNRYNNHAGAAILPNHKGGK